jgi:hypothetical protein
VEIARTARAISVEIANPWGQIHADVILTLGLQESGAYAEAMALARANTTCARAHGSSLLLTLALMHLGALHRAALALAAARAIHMEAWELNRALGSPALTQQMIAAELCADATLAGEWAAAGDYVLQLVTAEATEMPRVELTLWHQTVALIRAGHGKLAHGWLQRFEARIGTNGRFRIPYLCARATLAHWCCDISAATTDLETARGLAEAIGLLGERWTIDAALGVLYQAAGNPAAARQAHDRSAAIVQLLAAQIGDSAARQVFVATARRSAERLIVVT